MRILQRSRSRCACTNEIVPISLKRIDSPNWQLKLDQDNSDFEGIQDGIVALISELIADKLVEKEAITKEIFGFVPQDVADDLPRVVKRMEDVLSTILEQFCFRENSQV